MASEDVDTHQVDQGPLQGPSHKEKASLEGEGFFPPPGSKEGLKKKSLNTEIAAAQLLTAGAGLGLAVVIRVFRLFKRQQKALKEASGQLSSVQEELTSNQALVKHLEKSLLTSQEKEAELRQAQETLDKAREELEGTNTRYHEAASFMQKTIGDLQSTQNELDVARVNLQEAYNELQSTHHKLSDAQGELGLTRSENELLKRDLEKTRRQLEMAQDQMRRYHMDAHSNRSTTFSADEYWD